MSLLSLVYVLIAIAVFGLIVWAIVTYIPMPPTIKRIVVAVAVVGLIIFLVRFFGLLDGLARIRV